MTEAEGRKPHIVVGRRARWAALVLGVLLVHGAVLQRAAAPRVRPAPVVPAVVKLRLHGPDAMPGAATITPVPAPPPRAPQEAAHDARLPLRQSLSGAAPATASAAQPAASASTEGDLELPVYPTQLPPPLRWHYRFKRGDSAGSAELEWQHDGHRYQARLRGEAGGVPVFEWRSTGALDAAGVAPERYLDRRRGRSAQAANFQRDDRRITYSGPTVERPLPPGAQDRLSWLPQLAGIVAAAPGRWQPGQAIRLFVSGARGDADVWDFRVAGVETLQGLPGAGPTTALRLLREPRAPYDLRAEVWLDPSRHCLPVQARFTNGTSTWDLQLVDEPEPAP